MFGSPLAGWLFAMEVIARKINKSLAISCTASALIAGLFIFYSIANLYWILILVAGNGRQYRFYNTKFAGRDFVSLFYHSGDPYQRFFSK